MGRNRFIDFLKDMTGIEGAPIAQWMPPEVTGKQTDFKKRFMASSKKNRLAERTSGRRMLPEEVALMEKDWKAYSKSRGYTEQEIADFEKHLQLIEEGKMLGYTEDDLFAMEYKTKPEVRASL